MRVGASLKWVIFAVAWAFLASSSPFRENAARVPRYLSVKVADCLKCAGDWLAETAASPFLPRGSGPIGPRSSDAEEHPPSGRSHAGITVELPSGKSCFCSVFVVVLAGQAVLISGTGGKPFFPGPNGPEKGRAGASLLVARPQEGC